MVAPAMAHVRRAKIMIRQFDITWQHKWSRQSTGESNMYSRLIITNFSGPRVYSIDTQTVTTWWRHIVCISLSVCYVDDLSIDGMFIAIKWFNAVKMNFLKCLCIHYYLSAFVFSLSVSSRLSLYWCHQPLVLALNVVALTVVAISVYCKTLL